jgi:hypothetical protein
MEIPMAETAPQIQFRDEFIAGFEDRQSVLRSTVTTEADIKGNQAVFLVVDSNNASAVTRGSNGLIEARADNQTQLTCTLAEWHDLRRKSGFNVTTSQGNQRRVMQMNSMAVINRKIDDDIIAQLDTATNDTGTSAEATLDMVMKSRAILGNAYVDLSQEDKLFGLITPAFDAFLMQVKEYAASDYVEVKPFSGPIRRFKRWAGFNWITHPRLTGVGTSTEKCYLYHQDAIGHAIAMPEMSVATGYDEEQDYSFCRVSGYFGSKLLQNSGIVQMKHDGSRYVAA